MALRTSLRRHILRFVLISFLSLCLVVFLPHFLRGPELSHLPDPSEYLITKDQMIPAVDKIILNHSCSPDRSFVIVVESSPRNFHQRKIIRSTYANYEDQTELKYQVLFALAASLDSYTMESVYKENAIHNDIIQWNFTDSYKNLVIKSTAIMRWASKNCASSEFIVKADDDVYINIYKLLREKIHLSNLAKRNNRKLIFGRTGNIHPARKYHSKWYLPTTVYSNETFPKFVTGVGYIVSSSSCDSLFKSVIDSTPVLINEDVIVTGIAAEKAGVTRVTDDEEPSLKTYYLNEILDIRKITIIDWFYKLFPDRTDIRNTFYIGHYMGEKQFYIIHDFVKANLYFTVDDLKREFD